jgi:hypothetical protein
MDCHNCKFSAPVPGSSHHSECQILEKHQIFQNLNETDRFTLKLMLVSGRAVIENTQTHELQVQISEHGKKNGWADWPLNFDPIWVKICIFFDKK